MLARRFTVVCLLTSLFGICVVMLVADTGRDEHELPALLEKFSGER